MMTSNSQRVFLQIVEVEVQSKNGGRLKTHALLDSGSQATLVKEDFAKRLALTGTKQAVHVGSIKEEGEPLQVERVSFSISSTDRKCTFDVSNAYVMPRSKFNTPSQRLPTSFKTDPKYKYLHGLKLCNVSAKEVDLLIGADIPEALIATQVRRGPSGQPYAVDTPFGWTLLGVADAGAKSARIQIDVNHMQIWKDDELHNRVEEFWLTEAFGTKYSLPNSFSPEDESVLKSMYATTTIVNGHYEVGMLWKQSTVQLPNNYVMAERRFKSLMKRFKADQSLHRQYSEAPFTRERNRSVPYHSVPKSGTLRGCVHTGTLEITSFRSKKWNDEKSDTKSGTIRNRSVPFPCEQAMRSKLVQKTER